MKQQKKYFIIYGSILSLLVVLVGGFFIAKTLMQKTDVEKSHINKDEFYSIRNNATQLQKDLYEDLKNAIKKDPRDEIEMVELVSQNFVADFYTWTNKYRKNDVGGLQFVNADIRTNVYQDAQDTFYQDMYYYLENGGVKKTLEIEAIRVVNSERIDFFIFDANGEDEMYDEVDQRYRKGSYHDAYKVVLNWNYKATDSFDVRNYDQSATIVMMVNEQGVPMIVEVNHEEI